ncbi:Scr1 family TA system antitoxin-like transcriptional regulator [Streptomyces sp. NPDC058961]|uniref:Scr1 family TA system antitoxin-like transcriptional regulator n=1 Tax=Streptomyces sp. NPDC058961 TaxID=3346680 RepID=UPI0036CFC595
MRRRHRPHRRSRSWLAVTIHLLGLFQTEPQARAVFTQVVPPLSGADLLTRLAHRMDRKQVLERPDPPRVMCPYGSFRLTDRFRMRF